MCFSAGMSAALAAVTLLGGAYCHLRTNTRMAIVQMLYVFGAMELLQLGQWLVVVDGGPPGDACARASPLNRLFTVLAWVHVSLQPLSMNAYLFSGPGFYSTPEGKATRKVVLRLCAASAALTLARLPLFNPLVWLRSPAWEAFAARWLPELPTLAMAGKHCSKYDALCGRDLCTYVPHPGHGGSGHLAWSLPLLPSTYFSPNASLHFFVFFMPALVMARHLVDHLLFPVLMVSGPLLSMALSAAPAAGAATGSAAASYGHEWPSVWCMMSVVQVALAFVREAALGSGKSGRAARAKAAAEAAAAKARCAEGAARVAGAEDNGLRRRRA